MILIETGESLKKKKACDLSQRDSNIINLGTVEGIVVLPEM